MNEITRECLKCGGPLTENDKGFICTKECGFVVYKVIAGKTLPPKAVDDLFKYGSSGWVEGFTKKDTSDTFSACIEIRPPEYRPAYVFTDTQKTACPICKGVMEEFFKGIKCQNEECGFIIWNNVSGKAIAQSQINKLLSDGKTDKLDGFISAKNGKTFSAYLVVNTNARKVGFQFDP